MNHIIKRTVLKRILITLLIIIATMILLFTGLWAYTRIGYKPYKNMVSVDTVDKITIQYGGWDEYELEKDSEDYRRAIELIRNFKVTIPRFDNTIIFGTKDAGIYFYLNNGEKHRIWLVVQYSMFWKSYHFGYVSVDGKQYMTETSQYREAETFIDPYIKIIKEINKR